ncbi:tRNA-specific adenosine deaminase [Frankia sp. CgS1]|uniref:tRNA-adenosine deaminase n=2 Tax=Frankiaceae TaxID=74712 RepID=Q2J9G7_FRACC|nr:tRNA-adenosine deaminase [Frankia casuarinae]OHV53718.1 tRNA-specific adenosine deaminase [Frankia sp. CgIS1]
MVVILIETSHSFQAFPARHPHPSEAGTAPTGTMGAVPIPTAQYEPWMRRALKLATTLPDPGADDPPVGAVIYGPDGTEIAAAHHDRERTADPTAYAEILALRQAAQALGTWRLTDCTLVTTLEPGTMSAGAIVLARIPRLIIGTWDKYNGAVCSLWDVVRDRRLNHFVEVIPDVLKDECDALLDSYLDSPSNLARG